MAGGNLVQSLLRAADIVNLVVEAKQGISLQELSSQLGLNNTTVYNLIRTLAHRNWLRKDSSGRYFIGNALIDIAVSSSNNHILERSAGIMLDLAKKYPEAIITLSEFAAGEIWCRRRVSPDKPGIVQQPDNQKFMPYTSVTGLIFQAFLPEDLFDMAEEKYPFYEFGIGAWGSEEKLAEQLKIIKTRGYAETPNFHTNRGFLLAVPIKNKRDDINYVIGLSIKTDKVPKKETRKIIKDLQEAASSI